MHGFLGASLLRRETHRALTASRWLPRVSNIKFPASAQSCLIPPVCSPHTTGLKEEPLVQARTPVLGTITGQNSKTQRISHVSGGFINGQCTLQKGERAGPEKAAASKNKVA